MSKLLSPSEPARFTPAGQDATSEEERVVYLVKVPTIWGRIDFGKALAARGARSHPQLTMLDAVADGVRAIYGEQLKGSAVAQEQLAALAEHRERLVAFAKDVVGGAYDAKDGAALAAFTEASNALSASAEPLQPLVELVTEHYPRLQQMRADNAVFAALYGAIAAKKFVVGWENLDIEFARGVDGLSDEILSALPEAHLLQLGGFVRDLMSPTEAEAKNSGSPSPSETSQRSSATARNSPPITQPPTANPGT